MTKRIFEADYATDLMQALTWKHDKAEKLQALITAKENWYSQNHDAFWSSWHNDVFNLDTATDFGLSVWSLILDQPLYFSVKSIDADYPAWGFENRKNFDNGNFAPEGGHIVELTTEQKRLILKLRYLQLTIKPSLPNLSAYIPPLFDRIGIPNVFFVDGHNMTMGIVFPKGLTYNLNVILSNYDILPRPSGVKLVVVDGLPTSISWGFGRFHQNFDNGNFRDPQYDEAYISEIGDAYFADSEGSVYTIDPFQ